MRATDEGSMLRMGHITEAVALWRHLSAEFTVQLDGDKPMRFDEMCEPYCVRRWRVGSRKRRLPCL